VNSDTILVVDDEKNLRASIVGYLELEGFETAEAENGLSAQRLLETHAFSAAVLDLRMPGMDGMQLLEWIKTDGPPVPVLMISAHGDISDAVEAMKLGAKDYLVKPFDPAELVIRLRRIIEERRLRDEIEAGRRTAREHVGLIGESDAMQELRRLITRVAGTPSTVLITGESGVGKEVVARAVHAASRSCDGPFVAINIGGVPAALLESELFGHEKGAFTGAESRKAGMFELASRGTLFLDEIGELPGELQVKLLRVIQERKLRRLGGTTEIPIDSRIIAATNRDLEGAVSDGEFREDLFYRLNVVRIIIPPLRERPDDVAPLVGHFIERLNAKMGTHVSGLTPEALAALRGYPWPGNVRELENIIERSLIFAESPLLEPRDLGMSPQESRRIEAGTLAALEREAIERALHRWEGNQTKAAEELGISRRTLYNKIREYGLDLG
jgi:two-component system, NtrC family, response regulator AtoC